MRKLAFLFACLLVFSSCAKPDSGQGSASAKVVTGASADSVSEEASSSSETSSEEAVQAAAQAASEAVASEEAAKAASEAAASEEAARAVSQAAASEEAARAASQAAASEEAARAASQAAASEEAARAASEAAASEEAARAASEAAASEEAARAASEAAASEAAAQAASEAAAEKAAAKKSTAKKVNVSGANFLSDVESEVLQLQNEERARLGLQPLQYDADLQAAARIRSRELCKAGMFAHTRTDGREWYTVLKEDVPYAYKSAGENLGTAEYNDPSVHLATDPDFWVDSWIDSPPHYKNMIRSEYNRAGVGIYSVVRDGMTYAYATTIFAYVED